VPDLIDKVVRSAPLFRLEVGGKMGMILEISAEPGFLNVCARGEFSLAEAQKTFVEMLEVIAQHKTEKVLFDGRRLVGNPKFIERFFYGKFAAQAVMEFTDRGVSSLTQFAYVLEIPMLEPQRFAEIVARSRGMNVKAFDNIHDSHRWLKLSSDILSVSS
jgi:hypothetical protein